ncbi:MAG: hypothetical protein IPG75_16940 [Gemmatimonadetes bacterium]|nr:hypothetical protein [Gemmatimonadota bacterium]
MQRMTGLDLERRRMALGWTADQVGEALGEHTEQVEQWERIRGALPGSVARRVEWVLACLERQRAFEAAGLPACTVAGAILEGVDVGDADAFMRAGEEAERHTAGCAVCQARARFAETLPPLPPMPLGPLMRAIGALHEWNATLPAWLRPGVWGAVGLGAMTVFRVAILSLMRGGPTREGGLAILMALGAGAWGGVVGGVAYRAVRPRTRHLGRGGDYSTGVACTWTVLAAFVVPYAIYSGNRGFQDPVLWIGMLVGATVGGVYLGRAWFGGEGGKG